MCLHVSRCSEILRAELHRPNHDYIIFSGSEDEAAGQYLRGKVILRLPVPQKIKGVRLFMVGHLRLS